MSQPDWFAAEGVTMERRVRVVDDDLGIVEHRQIEVDGHTLRVTREDGRVWLALGPYSDVVRPRWNSQTSSVNGYRRSWEKR